MQKMDGRVRWRVGPTPHSESFSIDENGEDVVKVVGSDGELGIEKGQSKDVPAKESRFCVLYLVPECDLIRIPLMISRKWRLELTGGAASTSRISDEIGTLESITGRPSRDCFKLDSFAFKDGVTYFTFDP